MQGWDSREGRQYLPEAIQTYFKKGMGSERMYVLVNMCECVLPALTSVERNLINVTALGTFDSEIDHGSSFDCQGMIL